jgi:hypothetical protein
MNEARRRDFALRQFFHCLQTGANSVEEVGVEDKQGQALGVQAQQAARQPGPLQSIGIEM